MAFHPYPQVIRPVFNLSRFGPPRGLTLASTCPWVDHSVSGLHPTTERPVQTRFRYGSVSLTLPDTRNSPVRYAKSTPSLHEEAPTACRRTVSGTISLFCSKCFSPFPHGTGSLSVSQEYLALADGPARFTQDFSCPALLRILASHKNLRIPDYHRLRLLFPKHSTSFLFDYASPTTPVMPKHHRFGLFPVRSPLLRKWLLLSFPEGTKMFQFPSFASIAYVFSNRYPGITLDGFPHSEIPGSKPV